MMIKPSYHSDKKAFTLVELSVVLVIIGLLVGAVIAGKTLIHKAELRSVVAELETYRKATQAFVDQYKALPGDLPIATEFWGSAGGSGTIGDGCEAVTGSGKQTCNGDGDGELDNAPSGGEYGEIFTFWQHLANSGMINGNYTGIAGADNMHDAEIEINSPASALGEAGWSTHNYDNSSGGSADYYAINYGNHFVFGNNKGWGPTRNPALTPKEAWQIDDKIDDGKPAYGKVIALYYNDLCAAADDGSHEEDDFEASYKLSDPSVQCAFHIMGMPD